MRVRTLSAVLFATLAAMVPPPAVAAPMFQWLEPYDVAFAVFTGSTGTFTSGANFGQTATANLQKADLGTATDVGPSTAFMRALMDARSGPSLTDAIQSVGFSRAFRLSGSPNGWQMSLTGFYLGFLGIQPLGNLSPKASVDIIVNVSSLDIGFNAVFPIIDHERVTLDNSGRTSTTSGNTLVDVPDGNYNFVANLSAEGSIQPSSGFGQAFSDFFSLPPGFGLSLTLNAVPRVANLPPPPPLIPPPPPTPPPPILTDNSGPTEAFFVSVDIPERVPEPSSALLLLAGLATLLFRSLRPKRRDRLEARRHGTKAP